MFKNLFSLFCFCAWALSFHIAGAQEKATPNPRIRALKIQVVTKNMGLTAEQKPKFLALYTEYANELLVVYRAKKALRKNPDSKFVINERQRLEQQIVTIKGKYKNDFLKIISPQQLEKMYRGEEEFKRMLIERLKREGKY